MMPVTGLTWASADTTPGERRRLMTWLDPSARVVSTNQIIVIIMFHVYCKWGFDRVSYVMRDVIITQRAAAGGSGSDGAPLTASSCDPSPSRAVMLVASCDVTADWAELKWEVVDVVSKDRKCVSSGGRWSVGEESSSHASKPGSLELNADLRSALRGGQRASSLISPDNAGGGRHADSKLRGS